jgi:hypothetical protein
VSGRCLLSLIQLLNLLVNQVQGTHVCNFYFCRYNEIAVHAFGTLDQKGSGSDGEPKTPGKAKVSKAPRSKSSSALDRYVGGLSNLQGVHYIDHYH